MDPFIGEIRLFGGTFAPNGWAFCQGQVLTVSQYASLFALLGYNYGGNGTTTFALPNLQGMAPLGPGQGPGTSNYALGQIGGEASHTLALSELPAHTHTLNGDNYVADLIIPTGCMVGKGATRTSQLYSPTNNPVPMATGPSGVCALSGSNDPHENRQPFVVLNYIIALQGIYPTKP